MLSGPDTEVAVVIKHELRLGGAKEDRTPDLLRARQALSQLSYGPDADSESAGGSGWI